jgi:hypothetical protein
VAGLRPSAVAHSGAHRAIAPSSNELLADTTARVSPDCISNSNRPEPSPRNSNTDTDGPHGREAGICNVLTSTNVRVKGCGLLGDPWKSNEHARVFQSNRTASRDASWRSTAVVKGWLRIEAACATNERRMPQSGQSRPTGYGAELSLRRRQQSRTTYH